MKKRKLTAGFLLVVMLLQLMTGCGTVPVGTDPITTGDSNTTGKAPGATESEPTITVQYLPETVDNPEDLPVLKWVCMVEQLYGGGNRVWSETAVIALNQMLADKEMPFRIQFAMVTMDQWLDDSDWFSRTQVQKLLEDADLLYGVMKESDVTQYLSPVTDYINGMSQPSISSAVPHKANWIAVNDEIYALRTAPVSVSGNAWQIDSALMTQCGLTAKDFEKDFWEMDAIFQKIYSQLGHPFMFYMGDFFVSISTSYLDELPAAVPSCYHFLPVTLETIGSCFAIDHSGDSPKVVNILETDAVRKIQQAILRYREKGYYTSDQGMSTNTELIKIQYTTAAGNTAYSYGNDYYIPRTALAVKYTEPCGPMTGVANVSQHKEEALMLLNLIAEDEAFRMLLFHGTEGQDYKMVDGYYNIIKQSDGSSYSLSMLSPLSYFSGLTADRSVSYFENPGTENWNYHAANGKTALQTYQEALDHASIYYYPIRFDFSGFEDELAAIEAVAKVYFSLFTNYMDIGKPGDLDYVPKMTEEVYNEMLQKIKDAGSEKIQDELQRQLDEWIAANPDWLSQYS